MSNIPTHIAIFLKKHGKHKEGDLVLIPGKLVTELVDDGVISIEPHMVGDDFSKLIDYKG